MIGCHEAEAAYLGALLMGAAGTAELARRVDVGDVQDPRHRLVLTAVHAVLAAGGTPDPVTVLGELRRTGAERSFLDDRSAGVFLAELARAVPLVAAAGQYAAVVREHSARRRVAEAAERLQQHAGTAALDDLRVLVVQEWLAVSVALRRAGLSGIAPLEAVA